MPRRASNQRNLAAKLLRESGNVSAVAREVGVARATLYKWMAEPGFLDEPPAEPPTGLKLLLPKAMQVLDDALDGKRVTTAQIRAALEVVKTSNALKEPVQSGASLADLIAQLDEEGALDSD